jgi:hypothetical protein
VSGEGPGDFGGPNPIGGRPQPHQNFPHPNAGAPQWQPPPAPYPHQPVTPAGPNPHQPAAPAGPNPQQPYPPAAPWSGPASAGGFTAPPGHYGAAPYGGLQPFPAGPSFGSPPFGGPPPRNRRRLILTVAGAVIAVIVVVAGVVVFGVGSSDSGGPKTAGDAVKGYLEALAKGDAAAALSYGLNPPPDKTLLTDEVLKKQLDKLPITDIKIVKSDESGEVQVTANFGDNAVDETLYLKRGADGGAWKLENVAYPLDFKSDGGYESPALIASIALFGKPIPSSARPYLFPGWVDVGNSNPNVATTVANPTFLLRSLAHGVNPNFGFQLTDAGREAAKKAILPVLIECAKSRELSPPNCPQNAAFYGERSIGPPTWTPPQNLDELDLPDDITAEGTIDVYGSVKFGLTLQSSIPALSKNNEPTTCWVLGAVDMTKSPPTFAIRKG